MTQISAILDGKFKIIKINRFIMLKAVVQNLNITYEMTESFRTKMKIKQESNRDAGNKKAQ